MDIKDLLVYKVKRPICITLNKCFLKIMECSFLRERGPTERDLGEEGENVLFIWDVLNGCSLTWLDSKLSILPSIPRLEAQT